MRGTAADEPAHSGRYMKISNCGFFPLVCVVLAVCGSHSSAGAAIGDDGSGRLDNNLNVVDLTDLDGELPLETVATTQVLQRTEDWEHSAYRNPGWPAGGGGDVFGYPTVVKNVHGQNPDGKYYLYYAHHDPSSGIGCAVSEKIDGPYQKAAIDHSSFGGWTDSQVLVNPNYRPAGPNRGDTSHYSSPNVVWNADEQLWFMYFHYFNHFHGAWTADRGVPGEGWQMTALATCPDLSTHKWTIHTDPAWGKVSVWEIVPVLPTTDEGWMKSQSSYHAIQRLPDGRWLAFLRGTPTGHPGPTVGFGTSINGRKWNYFPENPVIASGKAWTHDSNEYRPKFIGYLGDGEYLVAWAEHPNPHIIYSKTKDFKTFQRDPRGYAKWGAGDDGTVSAWREDNRLYLFTATRLHVMKLPVLPQAMKETAGGKTKSAR